MPNRPEFVEPPVRRQDLDLIARARAQVEEVNEGEPESSAGRPWAVAGGGLEGYEVHEEIARGGQGVVYRATQRTTRRLVAIKVMREGPFAGARDRMRFEREIELLAGLRHPNIVSILDTGRSGGCDYIVMDFVPGDPLDVYADHLRESLRQRRGGGHAYVRQIAGIMAEVCEAVSAAHVAGVVHRDLKPTNIRVTAEGAPHVLDFGLAKAAHADVDRLVTRSGQFVGTLPYASPEQAVGGATDTRSDVYALGVVLYQLLTRAFPYPIEGSVAEIVHAIQHVSPQPPHHVNSDVDHELETIVLRALSKEPARRYQTAGELGRDLQRYLAGEAIEAKRDSTAYVIRKLLSRNRGAVGVAAAFAAVVFAALGVTFTLWRDAAWQRDRALMAEAREKEHRLALADALESEAAARESEGEQRAAAERKAEEADAVRGFLEQLLAWANPIRAEEREVTARELLDIAAYELATGRFASQPLVAASLHVTLARAYKGLGLYEPAEDHAQESLELRSAYLGPDHPASVRSRYVLASIFGDRGEYGDCVRELEAVLEGTRQNGTEDCETSREATSLLGYYINCLGRSEEAAALFELALDLEPPASEKPSTTARFHASYADCLEDLGRVSEALEQRKAALRVVESAFPPESFEVLTKQAGYAVTLQKLGQFHAAEAIQRKVLGSYLRIFGDTHPFAATMRNNLGVTLNRMERFAEAEPYFSAALPVLEAHLGESHTETATCLSNLARARMGLGRFVEAEPMMLRAYRALDERFGSKHPLTLTVENNLSVLYTRLQRPEDAVRVAAGALARRRESLGPDHPEVAITLNNMALALNSLERFEEAERAFREALRIRIASMPAGHPDIALAHRMLGGFLLRQERWPEAEAELLRASELLESRGPAALIRRIHQELVDLYRGWDRPDEEARWQARLDALNARP